MGGTRYESASGGHSYNDRHLVMYLRCFIFYSMRSQILPVYLPHHRFVIEPVADVHGGLRVVFEDNEDIEKGVYNCTYSNYNVSMNVKSGLSHLERLRQILRDQGGIIKTPDLARFKIPRIYLSFLEKNGEIERVSRGVYKTPSAMEDEMLIFQSKYKSSIYSHETALFLHDLTDRSPLIYSVSLPSGYHSAALNASGHKVYYVNRKLFSLGVVSIQTPHGNEIKVTNLERTICDILRSRNQMDVQYLNTALKRYTARKDINVNLLYEYAKKFGVQKIVRQYIEVLL